MQQCAVFKVHKMSCSCSLWCAVASADSMLCPMSHDTMSACDGEAFEPACELAARGADIID